MESDVTPQQAPPETVSEMLRRRNVEIEGSAVVDDPRTHTLLANFFRMTELAPGSTLADFVTLVSAERGADEMLIRYIREHRPKNGTEVSLEVRGAIAARRAVLNAIRGERHRVGRELFGDAEKDEQFAGETLAALDVPQAGRTKRGKEEIVRAARTSFVARAKAAIV